MGQREEEGGVRKGKIGGLRLLYTFVSQSRELEWNVLMFVAHMISKVLWNIFPIVEAV